MDFSDLRPRPKAVRCLKCKRSVKVKPVGRLPTFCSPSCRQMAFRKVEPDAEAASTDPRRIGGAHLEMLTEFGLVTGDLPPSANRRSSHREPQDAHRDHRQAAAL
jgi:hypothetical protein